MNKRRKSSRSGLMPNLCVALSHTILAWSRDLRWLTTFGGLFVRRVEIIMVLYNGWMYVH